MIFDLTKRKSGGGWNSDGIAQNLEPYGDITLSPSITTIGIRAFSNKPITSIVGEEVTKIDGYAFQQCTALKKVRFPKVERLNGYQFSSSVGMTNAITADSFPSVFTVSYQAFMNCNLGVAVLPSLYELSSWASFTTSGVTVLDFGETADKTGKIGTDSFQNCTNFKTLIARYPEVCMLGGVNAFSNTPFASGGTGGTVYVPASLISSYESATNWSTILSYPNNQIKSIESTHTDPDAPIDLTLYYADGTPIPTT